jgi:hypothetical protein
METASPDLRNKWLAEIKNMPPSAERTAALTTFYKTLIQLDPPAAIDSLIHSDRPDRLLAIPIVSGAALPAAMPAVTRALYELPQEDVQRGHGPNYLGNALIEWCWADPVAVAHFLEENKRDDAVDYACDVVGAWAVSDPAAARAWLDRFDPHHEIQNAELDWLDGYFTCDRAAATNYLIAHADNSGIEQALGWFASEYLTESAEAATIFINRLPNDEAQRKAISDISSSAFGTSDKPSSFGQPTDKVAEWLITLPQELWPEDFESILARWEEKDPEKVVAWINQLSPETHDRVVAAYSSSFPSTIESDSEDNGSTWQKPGFVDRRLLAAMSISDESLRNQTVHDVLVRAFSEMNRAEVAEAIQATGLSSSMKLAILKLLPKDWTSNKQ